MWSDFLHQNTLLFCVITSMHGQCGHKWEGDDEPGHLGVFNITGPGVFLTREEHNMSLFFNWLNPKVVMGSDESRGQNRPQDLFNVSIIGPVMRVKV